jgi:4-hydroxy-4-methyl-2-oxoglutarate aldolase
MTLPKADTERFALVREHLSTPVVGDVLDQLERTHQFLPQGIQALHPAMVLVGRAMPVLITDVFETQRSPFGRLTEALDQLEPGDIYLARNGRAQCAAWGEILTATARARGAAGAVIDGFHRDTVRILEQDWPVFSRGRFAQDAGVRASVVDYRVPLEIDGVLVHPGDLIVGDIDGVVVVPSAVENEVLELALVKATAENVVREAIEGGMSSTTAFATYGVL